MTAPRKGPGDPVLFLAFLAGVATGAWAALAVVVLVVIYTVSAWPPR